MKRSDHHALNLQIWSATLAILMAMDTLWALLAFVAIVFNVLALVRSQNAETPSNNTP